MPASKPYPAPQHLYPFGNPAMPYAEVSELDAWIKARRRSLMPLEWFLDDEPEDDDDDPA